MLEIVLTGCPITAERAYEIGSLNRLAQPSQLRAAATELATEILEGAPLSVRAARDVVDTSTEMGRSAALQTAPHAPEAAYLSEALRKFPRAFASKRKPVWKGR